MRPYRTGFVLASVVVLGVLAGPLATTQAQTVFYGGVTVGNYAPPIPYTPVYGGYGAYRGGYPAYSSGYVPAYVPVPAYSPAQRQGYAEGRRFYETGVASTLR